MKVKLLNTGKVKEYDALYAARLIEQGQAVPVHERAVDRPAPTKNGKK